MLKSLSSSILKPAFAQEVPSDSVLAPKITGIDSLSTLFTTITNIVVIVGVALALIFLILAGIQYITARGDSKQATAAKDSLTNAIIGFIIVIGAISIRSVVLSIFNIDLNEADVVQNP